MALRNNVDPLHRSHTKKEAVVVQGIIEEAPTILSVKDPHKIESR